MTTAIDIKKIQDSIKKLEKKHGKGVVMDLNDKTGTMKGVDFGSTGICSLDRILGGGLPEGRVVELFGQESSGKTTLAIHIAAQFQKQGKVVAYLDLEHAFEPIRAKEMGLDVSPEKFLFCQPDWGEQALDIIDELVRAGVKLIVVDSVANMAPKAEFEGQAGDAVIGKVARLMSQAMRRLSGVVSKHKATILFINQVRQNIGGGPYANPNVTPGGNALKFWSSIRIQVGRKAKLKPSTGTDYIGIKINAKTVKNKVAMPYQETDFDLLFDGGIQIEADILDTAVKTKVLRLTGRTYALKKFTDNGDGTFSDFVLGTSKGAAVEALKCDPDLVKTLFDKINANENTKESTEEEDDEEGLSKETEHQEE